MKLIKGIPHDDDIEEGDLCQLIIDEGASLKKSVSRWNKHVFRLAKDEYESETHKTIIEAFNYKPGTSISFFVRNETEPVQCKFVKI